MHNTSIAIDYLKLSRTESCTNREEKRSSRRAILVTAGHNFEIH